MHVQNTANLGGGGSNTVRATRAGDLRAEIFCQHEEIGLHRHDIVPQNRGGLSVPVVACLCAIVSGVFSVGPVRTAKVWDVEYFLRNFMFRHSHTPVIVSRGSALMREEETRL